MLNFILYLLKVLAYYTLLSLEYSTLLASKAPY
jgi:hypothetical protein